MSTEKRYRIKVGPKAVKNGRCTGGWWWSVLTLDSISAVVLESGGGATKVDAEKAATDYLKQHIQKRRDREMKQSMIFTTELTESEVMNEAHGMMG